MAKTVRNQRCYDYCKMKVLKRTEFGNPILRGIAKKLNTEEILSDEFQTLIKNMRYTLEHKKYGVGLAAPQVNYGVQLAVVGIKSTPTRPKLTKLSLTIINPEIVKTYGYRSPMWEGCVSGGQLYAQVPRYKKIRLKYTDEKAKTHTKEFNGFIAQVLQHEVDHLNGILFVDRVKDTKSYMTFAEYKKLHRTKK